MPRPSILRDANLPSPVNGMNLADPASALPASEAALLLNTVSGEGGLMARPGFQEHATALPSNARSLLAFHGSEQGEDRFFAALDAGIYDITASGTNTLVYTFPVVGAQSGKGVAASYASTAGRFLLYADESNGYLRYSQASHDWVAPTLSGGVTAADIVFVLPWKNRVWLVEKNSSTAWYLDLEAIQGAATPFDFGRHFKRGGYLIGLWNWTRDGGSGADDKLVALSSGGDIVVFEGTDPAIDTTFNIVGSWNVGAFPAGRRLCKSNGGDLLILTTQGLLNLEKLLNGADDAALYDTRKLRPLFVSTMQTQRTLDGWELEILPQDAVLLVNTPGPAGGVQEQFALSLSSQGWSRWRGLDIFTMTTWQGQVYFATRTGTVCRLTGYLDNVALDGSTLAAKEVECWALHAYTTGGNTRRKQVRMMKPYFRTLSAQPSVATFARYDYDTTLPNDLSVSSGVASSALWGVAQWGLALWGASEGVARRVKGAKGIGTAVSAGVYWKSLGRAVLIETAIWWEEGGAL